MLKPQSNFYAWQTAFVIFLCMKPLARMLKRFPNVFNDERITKKSFKK